ncbi:MAG: penicillin acylase family protein [Fluviicola sp.]
MPPLGKFLNPYTGFVQSEENKEAEDIKISGATNTISIYYDERKVPHIFAENDHDMYLAQGYVTAKDRLWQMDFMSYASAGRLSEILGTGYLNYDRLQRRVGMLSSAKNALKAIEANPETKRALDAYTEGVNAHMYSLSYEEYPLEYKLMGYKPEPWTNLKSVLIMKYVSAMLTGYEEDIAMAHMLKALGQTEFQKLYPEFASIDLEQMNFLEKLNIDSLPYASYINYEFLTNTAKVKPSAFNPRLGSNNWAINASKSASGNPVLCNDPHLNLTLPSIWYEVQLSCNNTNVYGVSIPGTIGVIIGFNEKIAWGITNGATDVRDWYKPRIKSDYSAYEMDGKWKKMKRSIEKIKIKDHDPFFDTVYSTVHGPLVIDNSYNENPEAKNYALKWVLHEPTNDFLSFIHLNKAQNYKDFKESISHFKCPVQNFVYASASDTIAIHHQGMLYEKWNGQGRFLMDGSKASHLYRKVVSGEDLPQTFNPESGFLYSANNFPIFDTINTYFNGYYSETRAHRIKYLLALKEKLSIDDMKKMQLDNVNEVARLVLPDLLKVLDESKNHSAKSKKILQLLKKWKGDYDKNSQAAYFYDMWWTNIAQLTWDELHIQDCYLRDPDASVLLNMIRFERKSKYFDKLNTDRKEGAEEIILDAYKMTLSSYENQKWRDLMEVDVSHLARVEALGMKKEAISGHPDALNAISGNWGPSWRMIVEMGKRPRAYGIYAGGQSGNPGSKHYDEFVNDWRNGKYYELRYFLNKNEAKTKCKSQFIITK